MLQDSLWTISQPGVMGRQGAAKGLVFRAAAARYRQVLLGAQVGRLAARLTGRNNRLLHLSQVQANGCLHGGYYAGLRAVPIRDIRGSEGRCDDFDASFRPLQKHNRSRWMGLAVAWQQGTVLPPVNLIRVGDVYFVRDGHHRISVARAFGQEHIDAEVTVLAIS